ncbi:Xanthine dehydrogenase, molybdenum binding subunit, partial [hydrothermal vent metagenome]
MTSTTRIEREPSVRAVGSNFPRVDAVAKISGSADYVGDLEFAGMLHGKVLRSDIGHGRIQEIDTETAERMPGVVAVLTGKDLRDIDPYFGHAIRDRPIVAIDAVRFVGEPVAAVAAETEAQAEAALLAITVEYTDLPIVANLDAALASDAALIHEGPIRPGFAHGLGSLPERDGNVCYRYGFDRG